MKHILKLTAIDVVCSHIKYQACVLHLHSSKYLFFDEGEII